MRHGRVIVRDTVNLEADNGSRGGVERRTGEHFHLSGGGDGGGGSSAAPQDKGKLDESRRLERSAPDGRGEEKVRNENCVRRKEDIRPLSFSD